MQVDMLVEGDCDEIVVRKLLAETGHSVGTVFGKGGIDKLRRLAFGISRRSRHGVPLIIVADHMDLDEGCPGDAAAALLADRPDLCLVRLAVPEIESWVMASRQEFADYLGVSVQLVPSNPDVVPDAKQRLVNIARKSTRKNKRMAIVPQPGTSASVGPGYIDELARFIQSDWQLSSARSSSRSLHKAAASLEKFRQFDGNLTNLNP